MKLPRAAAALHATTPQDAALRADSVKKMQVGIQKAFRYTSLRTVLCDQIYRFLTSLMAKFKHTLILARVDLSLVYFMNEHCNNFHSWTIIDRPLRDSAVQYTQERTLPSTGNTGNTHTLKNHPTYAAGTQWTVTNTDGTKNSNVLFLTKFSWL